MPALAALSGLAAAALIHPAQAFRVPYPEYWVKVAAVASIPVGFTSLLRVFVLADPEASPLRLRELARLALFAVASGAAMILIPWIL